MKEQWFVINSRVTEINQLSIKGVIKLYISYNLITYFDIFIERKTFLCLSLHGQRMDLDLQKYL